MCCMVGTRQRLLCAVAGCRRKTFYVHLLLALGSRWPTHVDQVPTSETDTPRCLECAAGRVEYVHAKSLLRPPDFMEIFNIIQPRFPHLRLAKESPRLASKAATMCSVYVWWI